MVRFDIYRVNILFYNQFNKSFLQSMFKSKITDNFSYNHCLRIFISLVKFDNLTVLFKYVISMEHCCRMQ